MPDNPMPPGQGRPDPDPTVLTTQALMREIEAVKELLKDQDTNHKQMLKDKVEARHTEQLALMELLQAKIDSLAAVTAEKFDSIDREFALVERQRVELKADTKLAVDAALISQKEAVHEQTVASEKAIDKSEANTAAKSDEQGKTSAAAIAALSSKVDDLKDRVLRFESVKQGATDQTKSIYALAGFISVLLVIGTVLAANGVFR